MSWWLAPIGSAIGGAAGKALSKISDWIPGRDQYNRNKIKKLERERDEIIKSDIPNDKRVRLAYILSELSKAKSDLENR